MLANVCREHSSSELELDYTKGFVLNPYLVTFVGDTLITYIQYLSTSLV